MHNSFMKSGLGYYHPMRHSNQGPKSSYWQGSLNDNWPNEPLCLSHGITVPQLTQQGPPLPGRGKPSIIVHIFITLQHPGGLPPVPSRPLNGLPPPQLHRPSHWTFHNPSLSYKQPAAQPQYSGPGADHCTEGPLPHLKQEIKKILGHIRTVSSTAMARAMLEAAAGEYTWGIEILVIVITLIIRFNVAAESYNPCKILISSLRNQPMSLETKSYSYVIKVENFNLTNAMLQTAPENFILALGETNSQPTAKCFIMPQVAWVSDDSILQAVQDLEIFNDERKLLSMKNPVWQRIKERLLNKIKVKNLHQRIYQNRSELQDRIKNSKFCDVVAKSCSVQEEVSNSIIKTEMKDEYDALHHLAYIHPEYQNIIKQVGTDAFSVVYHTIEQEDICRKLSNDNNSLGMLLCYSNVLKPFMLKGHICNNVQLIAFCVKWNENIYVISELLLEEININKIIVFLMTLLKIRKLPKVIVLYHSSLLANSVSCALNNCSFSEYNENCFKIIFDKESVDDIFPDFVIKIELLSIIKHMKKNMEGIKMCKPLQNFFCEILIFLSQMEDIENFEKWMVKILTIVCSPFENDFLAEMILDLKTEIAFKGKELFQYLAEFPEDSTDINSPFFQNSESNDLADETANHKLLKFIKKIKISAEDNIKQLKFGRTKTPNGYFSSWYSLFLEKILKIFPSWTNFIENRINFNEVSLSSRQYFTPFIGEANKFTLCQFIEFDIAQIKAMAQNCRDSLYNSDILKKNKNIKKPSIDHSPLLFQENWKNKNTDAQEKTLDDTSILDYSNEKKIKKESAVDTIVNENINNLEESGNVYNLCVSVESLLESDSDLEDNEPILDYIQSAMSSSISHDEDLKVEYNSPPMKKLKGQYVAPSKIKIKHQQAVTKNQRGPNDLHIMNGAGLQKKKVNKTEFFLNDTSLFDALCSIFIFCVKYMHNFREICDVKCECPQNLCFIQLILEVCRAKNLVTFYNKRAFLLYSYGEVKENYISCDKNFFNFYSKILNNHYSIKEFIACENCDHKYEQRRHLIKICIDNKNLTSLTPLILEDEIKKRFFFKKYCIECGNSNLKIDRSFGMYIGLDIDNINILINLNKLSQTIKFIDNSYTLVGAIGTIKKDEFITYSSYLRRVDNTWIENKSTEKKSRVLKSNFETKISVMFYIKS